MDATEGGDDTRCGSDADGLVDDFDLIGAKVGHEVVGERVGHGVGDAEFGHLPEGSDDIKFEDDDDGANGMENETVCAA